MTEQFSTDKPIYLQLMEKINRQIIRRELKAGDKLPSVREMAINSGVNPNTIQRTYSELERMGIVETRRGQGTFVSEKEDLVLNLRQQLKDEQIKNFVKDMAEMGFSSDEMVTGLKDYLDAKREGE